MLSGLRYPGLAGLVIAWGPDGPPRHSDDDDDDDGYDDDDWEADDDDGVGRRSRSRQGIGT